VKESTIQESTTPSKMKCALFSKHSSNVRKETFMHRQKSSKNPLGKTHRKKRLWLLISPVLAFTMLLSLGGVAFAAGTFDSLFKLQHDSKTYSAYKVEVDKTTLVAPTSSTIKVIYKDVDTGEQIGEDTFTIPSGHYGPYGAKSIPTYRPGILDSMSAPIEGDIGANETKTIIYTCVRFFIVTYDPNGNEGHTSHSFEVDRNASHQVLVPIEDFDIRYDYQFNGYNLDPAGNYLAQCYFPGDTFTVTDDVILYAHWIQPS